MLPCTFRRCANRIVLSVKQVNLQQNAGITGRTARGGPMQRPKPFPYREKRYGVLQAFFDKTTWRFDENSKIIVVEGPIAAGKTAFAKGLADELDMLYLRQVSMDDIFINSYGYDYRQLNDKLPDSVKCFDVKMFLEDPKHEGVTNLQVELYRLKYMQYIDALAHIMNTGQGVVLERSPYSDMVFPEAMFEAGYISKNGKNFYYQLKGETLHQLMKPHLVIYLDVPVPKVIENIKKRAFPYEVKSKVLTPEYLTVMERQYKENVLRDLSVNCELLVYDWSNGGDPEVVVEDIERIDFDRFGRYDKKLNDWRYEREWDWCEQRIWFSSMKHRFNDYFMIPPLDCPELMAPGADIKVFEDVMKEAPNQYADGFNASLGDKNILFKTFAKKQVSPWFR